MTQDRIGPLWNEYLNCALKQFGNAKDPPNQDMIAMWKANFYAGVFAALVALGKDSPMNPAAYRDWILTRRQDVMREAEVNTANLYAGGGKKQ